MDNTTSNIGNNNIIELESKIEQLLLIIAEKQKEIQKIKNEEDKLSLQKEIDCYQKDLNENEKAKEELIKNDGEIAQTLEDYLFSKGLTDEIKNSIEEFHAWLRENLILTKNLIPHNIVIKIEGDQMILKIIDGLGSKAFFPLPSYSDFFAKRYVKRRIELMWSRINWDLSGRKGNWK